MAEPATTDNVKNPAWRLKVGFDSIDPNPGKGRPVRPRRESDRMISDAISRIVGA